MTSVADLNFHDSHLAACTVGPRHEVRLEIAFDPFANPGRKEAALVRAGAIENFPIVRAFFEKVPVAAESHHYRAAVARIERPTSKTLLVELEGIGKVEIVSSKITVS